jgi:uncharacterized 2Fe-2S/4Fe-4S cluster protein (DUF4445 family)
MLTGCEDVDGQERLLSDVRVGVGVHVGVGMVVHVVLGADSVSGTADDGTLAMVVVALIVDVGSAEIAVVASEGMLVDTVSTGDALERGRYAHRMTMRATRHET